MTKPNSLWLPILLAIAAPAARAADPPPARTITMETLEDKIRGGWAGQMIGVAYGTPTEFKFLQKRIDDATPIPWDIKNIAFAIRQDDLYVDMSFAAVMDKIGLEATTEQYGEAFKVTKFNLWHANAGARRCLNMGIKAPMSGHPKNNIHANDIDFQIEADFIGLMCPGLPQASNKHCERVGRVMNYGDGLYGGMFVCGMYAAAFFESDPRKVVEAGLACIPEGSIYAATLRDVLQWSKENPDEWRKTWQLLQDKWDKDDSCSDGALRPFNIDASFNGAYIAVGLLYGGGDFSKTTEITTRCGQDSDCNPSNSAGVLGTIMGYKKIPDEWKGGIPEIADVKFEYTDFSFNEISKSTLKRALEEVKAAGGKVEGDVVHVPAQAPKPPKLEQWSMGKPKKLVSSSEAAWSYTGKWLQLTDKARGQIVAVGTMDAGVEAEFRFEGTGAAIIGMRGKKGGRADVTLDGAASGVIDAYIVPLTTDNDYWHVYGLKPGPHVVKIKTRPDRDERSEGNEMLFEGAIVFE